MSDETATYDCPYCGEPVITAIDWSGGDRQEFVEDCPVCCSPIMVFVELNERGEAAVHAE